MTVSRTICLGFIAVITVGTGLLMMPFSLQDGTWSSPITALFTATSAVCVTGLSVVDVGKFYTFWGQLFIVMLVEVGGLGYMTATTLLLLILGRKFGLKDKLALQQSLDTAGLAGLAGLVQSIVATTVLFQLTGTFVLMTVFVPKYGFYQGLWFSLFHSVNSFNNAGFSVFSDSLIGYVTSPLVNLVITLLIIFGGLGYQTIMELYCWLKNRFSDHPIRLDFTLHFKVVTSSTIFLLTIGTILIFLTEYDNPETLGLLSFSQKLMAAWFQSVTTRTAGFNTINIGEMTIAGLFISTVLMFIGASPGSTGGGVKTTTSRILMKATQSALQGREEVLCYQRRIPANLIIKALGVVVGSAIVVSSATILTALIQPELNFQALLFEVVSAFATVGLSTGITANLSILNKLVIIATMYIGRVGVLLLMAAILGDPKPSTVEYPEENLLVG